MRECKDKYGASCHCRWDGANACPKYYPTEQIEDACFSFLEKGCESCNERGANVTEITVFQFENAYQRKYGKAVDWDGCLIIQEVDKGFYSNPYKATFSFGETILVIIGYYSNEQLKAQVVSMWQQISGWQKSLD